MPGRNKGSPLSAQEWGADLPKRGLLRPNSWDRSETKWRFIAGKITELNGGLSSNPCLDAEGYMILAIVMGDVNQNRHIEGCNSQFVGYCRWVCLKMGQFTINTRASWNSIGLD